MIATSNYFWVQVFSVITACCIMTGLSGDLDGTINPILVETSYTFTNGETARGFVSFMNGFDLPTNGTVTLNLAPGMVIEGPVTGDKSTIDLAGNCRLGPGAGLQGEIFVTASSPKSLIFQGGRTFTDLKLRLLGKVSLVGAGYTALEFASGSQLDLARPTLTECTLENLELIINSQTLLTSATNLATLFFAGSSIRCGLDIAVTINNPQVVFNGICSLTSIRPQTLVFTGIITLNEVASLTLRSLSRLRVKGLQMLNKTTEFILDNATLDVSSSSTVSNQIILGPNLTNLDQGRLRILGSSNLISTLQNEIIIPQGVDLVFGPKSRLALGKKVKLTVY